MWGGEIVRPFLDRIRAGEVLVGDGAMGTMLLARGLKSGECPEQLNLQEPELLEEIARLYCAAGADVVETNTFGGSPLKLEQYSLADRTEEINAAAVHAVRKSVGDRAYLSASIGPSAQMLEPYGEVSEDTMRANFERQARALAAAGIDLYCVETLTDLNEAIIAVRACKTVSPGTPVCATMTFDATPRGYFTIMGNDVPTAANGLEEAGADVIGSNCGNGIKIMVEIARVFQECTSLPLLIQSNAGLPVIRNGNVTYPETPEYMAEHAQTLIELGVRVIGGCCGTTPEHIAAIRRAVDQR